MIFAVRRLIGVFQRDGIATATMTVETAAMSLKMSVLIPTGRVTATSLRAVTDAASAARGSVMDTMTARMALMNTRLSDVVSHPTLIQNLRFCLVRKTLQLATRIIASKCSDIYETFVFVQVGCQLEAD